MDVVRVAMARLQDSAGAVVAGGEPPKAFLEKVGVATGSQDLTREGGEEARLAMAG